MCLCEHWRCRRRGRGREEERGREGRGGGGGRGGEERGHTSVQATIEITQTHAILHVSPKIAACCALRVGCCCAVRGVAQVEQRTRGMLLFPFPLLALSFPSPFPCFLFPLPLLLRVLVNQNTALPYFRVYFEYYYYNTFLCRLRILWVSTFWVFVQAPFPLQKQTLIKQNLEDLLHHTLLLTLPYYDREGEGVNAKLFANNIYMIIIASILLFVVCHMAKRACCSMSEIRNEICAISSLSFTKLKNQIHFPPSSIFSSLPTLLLPSPFSTNFVQGP